MAKACEWLARLSGWAIGACLVLALMVASGEARAIEDEPEGECYQCSMPRDESDEEAMAAYEECMENCVKTKCDFNCNGTGGYPTCPGTCNAKPGCSSQNCNKLAIQTDCECNGFPKP